MTNDPRLTLEAIMNGSNPYELVDSPFAEGKMEAWRAQGMAIGVGGALAAMHQLYHLVRNDAADAAARADEAQAREALVKHLCDQVAAMQERINRLADALEARQRADAEAARHQHRLDAEPITLPPDISEYQAANPPAEIKDDNPPQSDESEFPEPPMGTADQGALPEELAKYVETPDPEPPKGKVYPQPVSISLTEE